MPAGETIPVCDPMSLMNLSPDAPLEDPAETQSPAIPIARLMEDVSPLVQKNADAFRRLYPELLKKHVGQWVVFRDEQPLFFGSSKTDLYSECQDQGWSPREFIIRYIETDPPDEPVDLDALSSLD